MKTKICENCCCKFYVEDLRGYHFCENCAKIKKQERDSRRSYNAFLKKQKQMICSGVENVDYVIDQWNGYATKTITGNWIKTYHPDKTIKDYIAEFPNAKLVCESTHDKISSNAIKSMSRPEMKKIFSDKISGNKNPNSKENTTLEQRQNISPFSKKFKKYDGMTDEEKHCMIRKNIQCDRDDKSQTQIKYWINKGYTEDDAKEKIKEIQTTFTLKKCIEKYGEEQGKIIFRNRQEKWQNSFKHLNYSKISQELFLEIYKRIENKKCFFAINDNGVEDYSGHNHELRIKTDVSVVSVDFYYPLTNSIIEFDGDYWHSETRNSVNKTRDEVRDKSLKAVGYTRILIIRECDYRKNKEQTIKKCIDFLLN